MYYPFLDHLLSELDSRSVKPRPLFTITNLLPKNVGNWSPGRISFKEILGAYNPDIPEELDNYRKVTKVNVCVGKHDGTECTILWPQLLKRFLTVTHKSSQIYPGLFMTLSTNHHSNYYTERSFSALRRLKNLPEVHDERRSLEWTWSYAYPQAWCVIHCGRHRWRFCSIRKQKEGTSFSAICIDCNKYRWRKATFYCGTEINNLKFRYILHIQLTTHTIDSLEDLICVLPGHLRDGPTTSQKAGYAPVYCPQRLWYVNDSNNGNNTVEPLQNGHLRNTRKWPLWWGGHYGEEVDMTIF